jgi:mutator protein MutT
MIDVTAGILRKDDSILIARRGKGRHLEGFWEFPGGKLEVNETPTECLERELLEEFGIQAQVGKYLGESIYDYGDKCVRLLAYEVWQWSGDLILSDHDLLEWIEPKDAINWRIAPADVPLLKFIDK